MAEKKAKVPKIAEFLRHLSEGKTKEEAMKLSGIAKATAAVQMSKIKKQAREAQ